MIEGSWSVSLTNGSGCGSGRPKKVPWILRIRIRNTFSNVSFSKHIARKVSPQPVLRILIFTHPWSKNNNKTEGWKKFVVISFFVAINLTKLKSILFLKWWRKKFGASFQRITEIFYPKFITDLSKIWVWDPGSGKKPIPDPWSESRCQKGTGSRIRIHNTGLSGCKFTYRIVSLHSLPDSLVLLERLRWLDLSNNYLKSLPAGLDSLRQLAKLNLSFNQLTQLPIALGNIHTLKGIWYGRYLTSPTPFCGGTHNLKT